MTRTGLNFVVVVVIGLLRKYMNITSYRHSTYSYKYRDTYKYTYEYRYDLVVMSVSQSGLRPAGVQGVPGDVQEGGAAVLGEAGVQVPH